MPDIILINPPVSLEERYGKLAGAGNTMPSLGLLNLAAIARELKLSPGIIEASSLGLDIDTTLKQAIESSPRYAGLTATTLTIFSAAEVARRIKEMNPGIKVIAGGPHLTAIPEETMKLFPYFDIGVIGEGEETFRELINILEEQRGHPPISPLSKGSTPQVSPLNKGGIEGGLRAEDQEGLSEVSGIIYRKDGELIKTKPRHFLRNLDSLPFPAWDILSGFPHSYRPTPFRFRRLPAASLVSSRGCPNKCIFCDRSVFGMSCRAFSADYVLAMIKELWERYGVREILFEDDTFLTFRKRLFEICEGLLKMGIKPSWSVLGRVDRAEPEALRIMKKAGCWQIGYGIESGNQEILDFIGKRTTLKEIENALRWTKEAGIMTKGFFIIGHPTETHKTIQETLDFARKVALDDISINKMTPFPGSQLYDIAERYGTFDRNWKRMNMLETVFVPRGLTEKELDRYSNRFLKEFYLRPRIIASYIKRMISHPRIMPILLKGFISFLKTVLNRGH